MFDKYTYSVCLYGEAQQKEGHSSSNLGRFRTFEDDHSVAVFDNGAHCWQGPNRSIRVRFVIWWKVTQATPAFMPVY